MPKSNQLTIKETLARAKKAVKQGNISGAIQLYNMVLHIQPRHLIAQKGLRKLQKGLSHNQVMSHHAENPSQEQINALMHLYNSGEMVKAELTCNVLLQTYPQSLIVLNVLGAVLKGQDKLEEAVQACDKAIQLKPDYASAYYNRGVALHELGRLEDAVKSCDKAIQLKPDFAEAYCHRGAAFQGLGKLEEAVKNADKAIQLKPDFAEAYYNRGSALQELGQTKEAVSSFNEAIQLKPDYAEAHSNLSLALLLLADFSDGWPQHEWRMLTKEPRHQKYAIFPLWNGGPLEDKVIIVTAEQGIGDEIMFSTCIPDLMEMNPKKIILECDSRLTSLFARSFPEINVQGKRGEKDLDWLKGAGNIDFQITIGSLPKFFRSDLHLFPDRKSFLKPEPDLLEKWKKRYEKLGEGMKIGISWRGGSKEGIKKIRSTELQLWKPIIHSGVHFVNLQYGDCVEEINQFERETGVHVYDWDDADPLTDLDNFAAQIAALDLVISIDNSTVHFAGAVGTPVWVLTPFVPDWRWMLDRDDSPWYSTIKLFRQNKSGNWFHVFSTVNSELKKRLSEY